MALNRELAALQPALIGLGYNANAAADGALVIQTPTRTIRARTAAIPAGRIVTLEERGQQFATVAADSPADEIATWADTTIGGPG